MKHLSYILLNLLKKISVLVRGTRIYTGVLKVAVIHPAKIMLKCLISDWPN